ncbi:MAG: hypothetical protein EXS08_09930 [Planctomycetes bacterium]|nr:hypothetical protein [Planctomycetota bacterium]
MADHGHCGVTSVFARLLLVVLACALLNAPSLAQGKHGKGGKGGAPHGPSRKAGAKKPAAAPPPDPLKEADRITAVADHQTEVDEAEQKLLREHFKVCDLDGNGWLSLRELEITLALPKDDYRRADTNQDGRLDPQEFAAQKTQFFARLGAELKLEPKSAKKPEPPAGALVEPPVAQPAPEPSPKSERKRPHAPRSELEAVYPRPIDLLGRYDADKSKGLDAAEIEKLLLELGLELSADQLATSMDPDDSGQLETNELINLAWMASRHLPESLRPKAPAEPTLAAEPGVAADPAASPSDQIPSAAAKASAAKGRGFTHFGRLDADHDGFIGESDLRTLQNPARVNLRLSAVLSVLDKDGDGKLSEAEFHASMHATPR